MKTEERYSFATLANLEYRQVGGLLLWLCFFMVVINPLEGAFQIWRDMARIESYSVQPIEFLVHLLVNMAQTAMVIGGIVVGILLWRLQRNGVFWVKLWFVVYFGFILLLTLVVVGLAAMNGMAAEGWDFMWPILLAGLVKSGLWWLYLDRSYRVKRTYELKYGVAPAR